MKYGYARVSTEDQNPDMQLSALRRAGWKKVFKDEGLSGVTTKRAKNPKMRVNVMEKTIAPETYDGLKAMQIQLARLFGSGSKYATIRKRTAAQWRKTLKADHRWPLRHQANGHAVPWCQ
jgi:hypothetical protein